MNGIDVYEGNDLQDFNALKNQGVEVIIAKATQGVDYTDHSFAYRCAHVRQSGIKFGAYHFAGGLHSAESEAQHFLDVIKGQTFDTAVFLDIENYGSKTWGKQEAINFCNVWLNYVKARGYKVGLYTDESFYNDFLKENIPEDVVLWLANYSRKPSIDCSWQYSEKGKLNGAEGNLDFDNFQNDIFTDGSHAILTNVVQPQSNNKIATLQGDLNRLLGWKLVVDGIQGSQTTQAIKTFQRMVCINADGIAGNETWNCIEQILAKPLCGLKYVQRVPTRFIQYRLGISNDGIFGKGTAQEVEGYQESYGLTPDGIVGPATWEKLIG